jgi:hypothetical protein
MHIDFFFLLRMILFQIEAAAPIMDIYKFVGLFKAKQPDGTIVTESLSYAHMHTHTHTHTHAHTHARTHART